jgi:hypothetical protein
MDSSTTTLWQRNEVLSALDLLAHAAELQARAVAAKQAQQDIQPMMLLCGKCLKN